MDLVNVLRICNSGYLHRSLIMRKSFTQATCCWRAFWAKKVFCKSQSEKQYIWALITIHQLYLRTFWESHSWGSYSVSARIFEDELNISKEVWRILRNFQRFLKTFRLPGPDTKMCLVMTLLPVLFHENRRIGENVPSFQFFFLLLVQVSETAS